MFTGVVQKLRWLDRAPSPKIENSQKGLKSDDARKNGPHISPESDILEEGRPEVPPEIGPIQEGVRVKEHG